MPTIEIIGYPTGRDTGKKVQIFQALSQTDPELAKETVCVIYEKPSVEDMDRKRRPFVRVYSLNQETFEKVRLAIIKDEPTDIEFIQMAAFYPA